VNPRGHSSIVIDGQDLLNDQEAATAQVTVAAPVLTPIWRWLFLAGKEMATELSRESHIVGRPAFPDVIVETTEECAINKREREPLNNQCPATRRSGSRPTAKYRVGIYRAAILQPDAEISKTVRVRQREFLKAVPHDPADFNKPAVVCRWIGLKPTDVNCLGLDVLLPGPENYCSECG